MWGSGNWQIARPLHAHAMNTEIAQLQFTNLVQGKVQRAHPRSNFGSGLYPWPYLIEPGPVRLRTPSPAHARQTNVKTDMNVDRKTPPSWIFGKGLGRNCGTAACVPYYEDSTQCFAALAPPQPTKKRFVTMYTTPASPTWHLFTVTSSGFNETSASGVAPLSRGGK